MNLQETTVWVEQLFPGEFSYTESKGNRQVPEFHFGTCRVGAESVAVTLDAANIDTGLEAESLNVRAEMFVVHRATDTTALKLLNGAVGMLAASQGSLPAQPGTLLPALGDVVDLPQDVSVRHGLLVVPFVWGGQTPQVRESDRWTLMVQLIMLTPDEFNYAVTYGVEALHQQFLTQGIDLLDWGRP